MEITLLIAPTGRIIGLIARSGITARSETIETGTESNLPVAMRVVGSSPSIRLLRSG